jgi:hypothetical protein
MIWANESGVSIYIYEGEHDRRIIEIHGVVNDYETVLATATIEKHNRDNFAETVATGDMRYSASEVARLSAAAETATRTACVEKVKAIHEERLKDLHTLTEKGEVEREDAEYERAVLFVLSNVIDSIKSTPPVDALAEYQRLKDAVVEACSAYCASVLDIEENGWPKDKTHDQAHYEHLQKQTAMIDAYRALVEFEKQEVQP